jgi:pyruvate dehydrogenase E2 component (dihydrolipoamide acetyltransferase)
MATEVILPKVDMDQATGTISEWRKHNGDAVTEGETILVIETEKVAIDVESPGTGILDGITSIPGEVFPIGTVIGYILAPGEALPEPAAPAQTPQEKTLPPVPVGASATPVAKKIAAAHGVELVSIQGTGPQGKVTKSDIETHLSEPSGAAPGKVYATPAARRIARERSLELAEVSGSGPGGRIQAADVENYRETDLPVSHVTRGDLVEDQVIPLVGMRRTIAERLTMSYQTTPHISLTVRVDMTRFKQARADLNAHAENSEAERVSATAMMVKLMAAVLKRYPRLNSSLEGDNIIEHKDVNVGVAVALEDGLIVPVVHQAEQKSISQIAVETSELVSRARAGQLVPSDVSGGTFTISNLGPFGIEQFTAIINPPQAAILAVGATQDEAIPMGEQIVARPIMRITLCADHRIIDGALAAQCLAELKALLENPILLAY